VSRGFPVFLVSKVPRDPPAFEALLVNPAFLEFPASPEFLECQEFRELSDPQVTPCKRR